MSSLSIRFLNASRELLEDDVDVVVTSVRANSEIARQRGFDGRKTLRVNGVAANEPFLVRAFPMRHRPVGQFVMSSASEKPLPVELFCPVDPRRVTARFPEYSGVDESLKAVLERSTLERDGSTPPLPTGARPGQSLYENLTLIERAGLLNLFCKMSHVPIGNGTAWSFVHNLYRVRGDRVFVNVALEFRDRVKNALSAGGFKEADSSLHTPPPGFTRSGSFKTRDHYGNLQLTFFGAATSPLAFKVDADIDDAAGIEHAFQVLDHFLTNEDSHPFDIHQILTFFQRLDTGYELVV
jgi:hypothetical protein